MPTPAPDTPSTAVSEPAIHPMYLRLLTSLLEQRGLSASNDLARQRPVGSTRSGSAHGSVSRSDDELIGVSELQRIVSSALVRSGSPWLGLELGAAAQAVSHGPVGFAAAASGSLRQALDIATRFVALRAPVLRMETRRGTRVTALYIHENAKLGSARQFVLEATAVMLERLLQSMSGRRLHGIRYALPWSEPGWSSHYASYLSGPSQFNAPSMSLRFPNAMLDAACLSADPQAFELARQECERRLLQGAAERDLLSRIRRQLWGVEGHYPSAAESAAQLGVSLRTLYRGLSAAGTSYRSLLDEARRERAQRMLIETTDTVESIAERLGYSDTSNFSRCFRRWTSKTPTEFRRS